MRDGFNFGHHYPHINPATGRFVREDDLPDAILEMIAPDATFAPKEWILGHMTCQRATATVEQAIRATALDRGEPWTEGLVVKTSNLHGQQYWDPDDRNRFVDDYRFLESTVR
jgi:hypothetical protein